MAFNLSFSLHWCQCLTLFTAIENQTSAWFEVKVEERKRMERSLTRENAGKLYSNLVGTEFFNVFLVIIFYVSCVKVHDLC